MRYKSLDLWRGIACLSVLVFHGSFYIQLGETASRLSRAVHQIISLGWLGVPYFL